MFIQTGTWLGYQSDVKKVDTLSGKGAWNDLVEKGKIGEGVARALHTTFLVKVVATFSPAINSKYVESKQNIYCHCCIVSNYVGYILVEYLA